MKLTYTLIAFLFVFLITSHQSIAFPRDNHESFEYRFSCKLFGRCGDYDVSESSSSLYVQYDACGRAGYGSHWVATYAISKQQDVIFIEPNKFQEGYAFSASLPSIYKVSNRPMDCSDLENILIRKQ